jgi:phosphate starvation-inducible PhoH-like protein
MGSTNFRGNGVNRNPNWRQLRDDCLADLLAQKKLRPLTAGQEYYCRAMEGSTITLCRGPAGTGKTYVACGLAAGWLAEGRCKRLVLTRPLVTCSGRRGQGVGFLPGDLMDKVNPFMRPMLDVLGQFFDEKTLDKHLRENTVEVVPLDYMRGLSLADAVVIADEMQNAEPEQGLMLLTRLGQNSKLVLSGDDTQSDLPLGHDNALARALRQLWGVEGISFVTLTKRDIVRSGIIREVLERW